MMTLKLSDDLEQQLARAAAEDNCSQEDLIRQLLANRRPPDYQFNSFNSNRYLTLLENAFDYVTIHNTDGQRVYVSSSIEHVLGYTAEEIFALPSTALVHPDDLTYTRDNAYKRALQGETIVNLQYRVRHKDGHYLWMETSSIPIFDAAGRVVQMLTASRNITDQKQMQAVLAENEYFLNAVVDGAQSSIFVIDVDEDGDFWLTRNNPASKRAIGLEDVDFFNKRPEDIPGLLPEVAAHFRANYQRCVDAGEAITYEEQLTANDQTTWWTTQLTPLKDETGRIYRIIGFSLETTKQRQAMLALEASEKRFRSLVELAPDAIAILDADGLLLMANEKNAVISGYDKTSDMIGRNLFDLVAPEDRQRARAEVQTVVKTGEPLKHTEYTLLRRDGSSYPAEISLAMLPSSVMLVVVIRDITRRKQAAEQAFKLALEKERSHILANFLQDTAHEFRTPITIVGTTLYLMERKPEQFATYSARIQTQLDRLLRLVDELRLMAALDTDYEWQMEPINLGVLLNEMCRRHEQTIATAGQTLVKQLPATLPSIQGEAEKLIQAIEEVLRNAIQYTPAGGDITVSANERDEQIVVTIADTGGGMPESVHARAFERFFRADTAHTTAGFGLGLPMAQKIIQAHGGEITLTSTPEQGTTVYITLPMSIHNTA